MMIQFKGLNPNETYCCTKKELKQAFGNTDIKVYFGVLNMSRNEQRNSKMYSPLKNCNDIIVANMIVHRPTMENYGYEARSFLSFFLINKKNYTEELKSKFVSEVLPILRKLYEEHKNDDYIANHGAYEVTIGLKDNQFIFYESTAKKYD